MHANVSAICRQAARLNLPFAPDFPCRGKRPTIIQDQINEKRDIYRALWEDALEANPHGNLKVAIKAAKKAYSWLKRHDREWLKEHYPTLTSSSNNERLLKRITQIQQNHYLQIDSDLARAVKQTAEKIAAQSDFPTQITHRILIKQIGEVALTRRSDIILNNLPLTSQAIKGVIETDIAFIWRKLRWTVQSFLTEDVCPAFFIFIRRARIGSLSVKHPFYREIIQFAYKSLQNGYMLDEQVLEALSGSSSMHVASSSIPLITEAAFGSLASVFINRKLDLQRPLKREKEEDYALYQIFLLTIAAVVSGAETYRAIIVWGYYNEKLLLKFGFSPGQFASVGTLERRWKNVHVDRFESILEAWLHDNFPEIKVSEIGMTNARKDSLPGIQLLRAYRHIALAVIEKLI